MEKIFTRLETLGKYDESLIILTSDHGDIFDEYIRCPYSNLVQNLTEVPLVRKPFTGTGYLGHIGRPLVEELVHVPLYIKLPDSLNGGDAVDGQVETIDILPTILDLIDIDPPGIVEGTSLIPKIRHNDSGKQFTKAEMGANPAGGMSRMIRGDQYKYIRNIKPDLKTITDIRNDLPAFLFQKYINPEEILLNREQENENVINSQQDVGLRMSIQMDKWKMDKNSSDQQLSGDKIEELETLGYL